MATARELTLDEEAIISECCFRLCRRRAKCIRKLRLRFHHADSTPAASRRSLDGHRITEFRRAAHRSFFIGDDTAAPRHDWNARIFGNSLRVDLVAERSHDITGRPQETHPVIGDPIRKVGIFRNESPTRPYRVRLRAYEQRDQPIVIEIGRNSTIGRFEPNRVVRVADKGRVAIDVGIDRDRLEIRILERS